jgi:hypothetical protein
MSDNIPIYIKMVCEKSNIKCDNIILLEKNPRYHTYEVNNYYTIMLSDGEDKLRNKTIINKGNIRDYKYYIGIDENVEK